MKKIKFLTNPGGEAGILSTKYADIETIEFLPDNIKAHDIAGIKESIKLFGFVEPIGINRRTGNDIFGNGRLSCLLEMLRDGEPAPRGIIEREPAAHEARFSKYGRRWFAPVVDGLDFSESDELTLAISMNRLNERGGIDPKKAYDVLMRIKQSNETQFAQTGYDTAALAQIELLKKMAQRAEEKPEDEEKHGDRIIADDEGERLREKWGVEPGDFWLVGKHRLVCGDSFADEDLQRLIGAQTVRLEFSDPPYDLNTKGGGLMKNKPHLLGIEREGIDKFNPRDLRRLAPTSVFFCNKRLIPAYLQLADDWAVTWDLAFYKKESVTPNTNGHLMTDVEYIFILGEQNPHGGMEKEVYSKGFLGKLDEGYYVGWQKPVALAEKFIRLYTLNDEIVLDRFLGTGNDGHRRGEF